MRTNGFLVDSAGNKSHKRLLSCACVFVGLGMGAATPWVGYSETLVEMTLLFGLSLAGATMAERPRLPIAGGDDGAPNGGGAPQ
jgi:hypothetical protein